MKELSIKETEQVNGGCFFLAVLAIVAISINSNSSSSSSSSTSW